MTRRLLSILPRIVVPGNVEILPKTRMPNTHAHKTKHTFMFRPFPWKRDIPRRSGRLPPHCHHGIFKITSRLFERCKFRPWRMRWRLPPPTEETNVPSVDKIHTNRYPEIICSKFSFSRFGTCFDLLPNFISVPESRRRCPPLFALQKNKIKICSPRWRAISVSTFHPSAFGKKLTLF